MKISDLPPLNLLQSWKIILGIITYIITGELLKELLLFGLIEPLIFTLLPQKSAEFVSEVSEYILLSILLIPISLFFVVIPVNRTNRNLFKLARKNLQLAQQANEKNNQLENEILIRKETEKNLSIERDKAKKLALVKSQFLAMMSHEIRTPMNGVLGTAQLLTDTNLSDEQRKYVETLSKSSKRLFGIINDILDFSKLDANKLTLVEDIYNPIEITQDVIDIMENVAQQKNLDLSLDVEGRVPIAVFGDALRVQQVLNNLISNAIKFTDRGRISVSIVLKETNVSNDLNLHFLVKDTGCGIPEDKMPQLFQEFSQIESVMTRSSGGTGLGLAICRRLVQLMGGSIKASSQEGIGSEFSFTIPLVESKNTKDDTFVEAEQTPISCKLDPTKILLVEDNQVNQMVAGAMLKRMGYSFDIASNGQEALEKLASYPYDIVFMDIHMPVMDGLTATKQIRQTIPKGDRPIIIALTADAFSEEKRAYFEAGIDDYMSKPINKSILKNILEKYSVLQEDDG